MATRLLTRRKLAKPIAVGALTAGILYPKSHLHADGPVEEKPTTPSPSRKPIYSDPPSTTSSSSSSNKNNSNTAPSQSPSPSTTTPTAKETPTTLLASQIRHLRLNLHNTLSFTEAHVNAALSSIFRTEALLTTRLRSLPAPSEPLVPGGLYILVAALSGTILTRNRNILFRATVPLGLGLGMAWTVLPLTMRNVSALVKEVEEGIDPRVREEHVRIVGAVGKTVELGRESAREGVRWGRDAVGGVRERVEELIRGQGGGR